MSSKVNLVALQSKLDDLSESGALNEGSYLELCNLTKAVCDSIDERQARNEYQVKLAYLVELSEDNPRIIDIAINASDSVDVLDGDVIKAMVDNAKQKGFLNRWFETFLDSYLEFIFQWMEPKVVYMPTLVAVIEHANVNLEIHRMIRTWFLSNDVCLFCHFLDPILGPDEHEDEEEFHAYARMIVEYAPLLGGIMQDCDDCHPCMKQCVRRVCRIRAHRFEGLNDDSEFWNAVRPRKKRAREEEEKEQKTKEEADTEVEEEEEAE